jgi:hypothetical protein
VSLHFRGPFANERGQTPPFDDCIAASGLNIANAAGAKRPTTHAEIEALRVASGDSTGGQSLTTLRAGIVRRYDLHPAPSSEWDAIATGIAHNRWFVVRGDYQSLPAHYRRFQPSGTFSHATAVGPSDAPGHSWWVDPLEPQITHGEDMSLTTLRAFCATAGFDAISLAEKPRPIIHRVAVKGIFARWYPGPPARHTPWFTRGFSAEVGPIRTIRYSGKTIYLAQVTRAGSAYHGWWLNIHGRNVDYT